jgi:leader peptidase (prepilin peptidase)/N-methyltransferase
MTQFVLILSFGVFILGLCIGSFLNVCIYRLPRNESVVRPPSHCPECGHRLQPRDLVPVFSYLLLKGHCRYCQAEFSPRYAAVELLTGGLFLWCLGIIGFSPALPGALALTAFLITVTFIDYDHQLILDKVVAWLAGLGLLLNGLLLPYLSGGTAQLTAITHWTDLGLGMLCGGGLLLLIAIVSKGGMGGGDIKFAAALGLWFGWKLMLLLLLLSFLMGGGAGALLLLAGRKGRKDPIPFGPYIAIAALIVQLYGWKILDWYFSLYAIH